MYESEERKRVIEFMLMEKQEEMIRNLAMEAWKGSNSHSESVAAAVVAGIKAYDAIQDVEDVKAAAKAANNSDTEEMSLDEAIKHYLDKALNDVSSTCKRDHLRVASWLSELRVRRSRRAERND